MPLTMDLLPLHSRVPIWSMMCLHWKKRIADAKREGAKAAKRQVKGTQSMPITSFFKKAE